MNLILSQILLFVLISQIHSDSSSANFNSPFRYSEQWFIRNSCPSQKAAVMEKSWCSSPKDLWLDSSEAYGSSMSTGYRLPEASHALHVSVWVSFRFPGYSTLYKEYCYMILISGKVILTSIITYDKILLSRTPSPTHSSQTTSLSSFSTHLHLKQYDCHRHGINLSWYITCLLL